MTTHRKIRFPKHIIEKLRNLRDSYITPRPIPKLVNACLKQTRRSVFLKISPTTRDKSQCIDLWIEPEFSDLDPSEIVSRVAHALIGIECKMIPANIKMHREGL